MKLSVLMAVYNEERTVGSAVSQVLGIDSPVEIELVVVDDGSTDSTAELLASVEDPRLVKLSHLTNRGKGAAIRTAAGAARGDYLVVCDADLEYDPQDIARLLEPVVCRGATVVFGTRTFTSHTAYSFWYVLGNRAVTMAANLFYNCWISDLETGLKLMPASLYRDLAVRADGFGMEAEVTAKLLRRGIRPYEVPVSYRARGREEGKKLTWRDGVEAMWILARVRLVGR